MYIYTPLYAAYSENALFLQQSSFLLPGIDQTNCVYSIDNQGKVYQNYILKYTPSNLSDFIDTFLLQSIYRFLQLNVDYAELEKMLRLAYIL